MYYFNYKNDIVEKYLVSFDKEEIEKLKIEIINNCSEIEHHEYEGTHGPKRINLNIRNYKEKFIGIQESRDSLQWPDQNIYHYSYDEYKFPKLVAIIDELLNGKNESLDKIFNYNPECNKQTINERIRIISNELDAIDNLDIDKKRKKLDELQKFIELKKLNIDQKSTYDYYIRLKDLINLKLIDTISIEEIKRIKIFFEDSSIKEESKILKKRLMN